MIFRMILKAQIRKNLITNKDLLIFQSIKNRMILEM